MGSFKRNKIALMPIMFGIASVIYLIVFGNDIINGSRFSDTLLFATLLAIIWYSIETQRMRKQLERQNEFVNRPAIIIDYDDPHNYFTVQNISDAPALSVCIGNLQINEDEWLVPPTVSLLQGKEIFSFNYEKSVMYLNKTKLEDFDRKVQSWRIFVEHYRKKGYEVDIHFNNTDGFHYKSKVSFNNSGPTIVSTEKSYSKIASFNK